jgi:type II secretory pathway pseudopilin PulG
MLLPSRIRRRESGYVLMTLLLIMSLMMIALGIILPTITFEIKRDREEEMVHRGVQYTRAIRAYYKKFNRYPAKVEDLENTNQMRFLRRRYKDPLTGKDFKLLHFGEVKMSAGGMIPGAAAIGPNGALMPNMPGGAAGLQSALGQGGLNQAVNATVAGAVAANMAAAAQSGQSGTIPGATSVDGSQPGTGDPSQPGQPGDANSGQPGSPNGSSGDKLSNTTFGGAPIVGVASVSKDRSIREYDKKRQYDQWQFAYDPTLDRGFLITTPYQPSLQMFGPGPQNVNGPGAAGQNGTNSGFGSSFGNSPSPMQNNPTSPAPGGAYGNQPGSPPQQQ